MKVNGLKERKMAQDCIYLQMAISTKENSKTEIDKVKAAILGQTRVTIKANG